jgi:hypothetical protein
MMRGQITAGNRILISSRKNDIPTTAGFHFLISSRNLPPAAAPPTTKKMARGPSFDLHVLRH